MPRCSSGDEGATFRIPRSRKAGIVAYRLSAKFGPLRNIIFWKSSEATDFTGTRITRRSLSRRLSTFLLLHVFNEEYSVSLRVSCVPFVFQRKSIRWPRMRKGKNGQVSSSPKSARKYSFYYAVVHENI